MSKSDTAVLLLFTGQGSQYEDMGKGLYDTEPEFKKAMDECNKIYEEHTGKSLLGLIYKSHAKGAATPAVLKETQHTQPALFALEYSIAEMWKKRGLEATMVLGHSIGEVGAACVAGTMSLESGMKLAADRGKLMQALPSKDGVMYAVRCGRIAAEEAIAKVGVADSCAVASDNGPNSCVVSGSKASVDKVSKEIGKPPFPLVVSHAFHSPLMKPMEDGFRETVKSCELLDHKTPLFSTVTGKLATSENLKDPEHWVGQLASPVLFVDAVKAAVLHAETEYKKLVVLEVGPNPVLQRMARMFARPSIPTTWSTTLAKSMRVEDSVALKKAEKDLEGLIA